jgi:hypothetical protein
MSSVAAATGPRAKYVEAAAGRRGSMGTSAQRAVWHRRDRAQSHSRQAGFTATISDETDA